LALVCVVLVQHCFSTTFRVLF